MSSEQPSRFSALTRRQRWTIAILFYFSLPGGAGRALAQPPAKAANAIVRMLLADQGDAPPPWATPPVAARPIDREHGYVVLVWQFKTQAQRDESLYRRLNLKGWHIDYGEGQEAAAAWGDRQNWPYYVDHAAGKGILHLTPRSGLNSLPKDGGKAERPWSLIADATLNELERRLRDNIPPSIGGPVIAIALDDEVSLGAFNSPLEVDFSPDSTSLFRQWLGKQYATTDALRRAWEEAAGAERAGASLRPSSPANVAFAALDCEPATFDSVREQISRLPPNQWRLAPWLDFRSFMDRVQAAAFAALVRRSGELAPGVPIGVVGAQQPSAYGGFDYSLLRHATQWMEAYDIGGTNEILRSFWSQAPRRGRMQTFFASGNLQVDQWFLWYYLAHGCRGVIAWPETAGKPWLERGAVHPHAEQLADTFAAVQANALSVLTHPDTEPIFSPIAVLYSHPSVQVGWAIDATAHGGTWPRRSSSLDNACLSSGKNRVAWLRLLEDLGRQPRIIDTTELTSGKLSDYGIRLLVLPQAFALSLGECRAVKEFVRRGGAVVADYGAAITDEHGTGYRVSPLDELFAIDRSKDEGWFDGKQRYEVNGEKYQMPFIDRLPGAGGNVKPSQSEVERAISRSRVANRYGAGNTLYLNQSPTIYFDQQQRMGAEGDAWRDSIGTWIRQLQIEEDVVLSRTGGSSASVELLRYRLPGKAGTEIWAIVANPTRQASVDGPGSGVQLAPGPLSLRITSRRPILQIVDLRTGETRATNSPIDAVLPASEAVIFQVQLAPSDDR